MIRLPVFLAALAASVTPAVAQTVLFETNAGSFELTLNPTGDDNLQPIVDNLLANVLAGNYENVVINRADPTPNLEVLQLGSFVSDTAVVSEAIVPGSGFGPTGGLGPVIVDADGDGAVDFDALSNTRGTVSLALSGPVNSGSLSFFVNVGDNSSNLDQQGFVPFAEASDIAAVDAIFNSPQQDLSVEFFQPGSIAFTNVPLTDEGDLIIIETVSFVSDDPLVFINPLRIEAGFDTLTILEDEAAVAVAPLTSSAAAVSPPAPAAALSNAQVPEPSTLGLLACSLLGIARRRHR